MTKKKKINEQSLLEWRNEFEKKEKKNIFEKLNETKLRRKYER